MSNETPKANPRRTKSALKASLLVFLALAVVLAGIIVALRHKAAAPGIPVHIGGVDYHLEVAATTVQQELGLGGRVAMDRDRGMLFMSSSMDQRCFWMKDMHFPLDIIWVSGGKKVTHIEQNVSPSTYPRTYCYPAQYVIELHAGEITKHQIHEGEVLAF